GVSLARSTPAFYESTAQIISLVLELVLDPRVRIPPSPFRSADDVEAAILTTKLTFCDGMQFQMRCLSLTKQLSFCRRPSESAWSFVSPSLRHEHSSPYA